MVQVGAELMSGVLLMGFLSREVALMPAHVHLLRVVQVAGSLPLLKHIISVNQDQLMGQTFSCSTMRFFGMEKGAFSLETHAVRLVPHHSLLYNCKHPQVMILKDGYVDMKVEILDRLIL